MFVELPQNLILFTAGAFFIGWILSAISSRMTDSSHARKRDPRDDRIRSMEAELRVAQTDVEKLTAKSEQLEKDVTETNDGIEKRDNVISHQQSRIEDLTTDLKGSVLKTRELRNELTDRATENIKSELMIRDVKTELEVAQASTDMIATGVLDYALVPEVEPEDIDLEEANDADYSKSAI
jgi:chromosome segregation ATPase